MYCMNCGTQLPDDANFCLRCGKPQKAIVASEPEAKPMSVEPGPVPDPVPSKPSSGQKQGRSTFGTIAKWGCLLPLGLTVTLVVVIGVVNLLSPASPDIIGPQPKPVESAATTTRRAEAAETRRSHDDNLRLARTATAEAVAAAAITSTAALSTTNVAANVATATRLPAAAPINTATPANTPTSTETRLPTNTPTATPIPTSTSTPRPPTATPVPTNTPLPTATLAPEEALLQAIHEALGDSNRDIERVTDVSIVLDTVLVKWTINDHFTGDWIRKGASMDAAKMLDVIHATIPEYALVSLIGSFAMQDAGGNVSEMPVMWLQIDKATVDSINWQDQDFVRNVLYQRLDLLASEFKLHPGFEE